MIKRCNNLEIGTLGKIIHVYDKHNFEVEFVDENDETIAVFTIDDPYLECIWSYKK